MTGTSNNTVVPYPNLGVALFEKMDNWLQSWLLAGSTPDVETFSFTVEENTTFAQFQVVSLNSRRRLVPTTVSVVDHYSVSNASIANAGSGGTNGSAVVTGTTGTGTMFQADVTIAGGEITAINDIKVQGDYTVAPTTPAAEPVTGGGLTGAELNLTLATTEVLTFNYAPVGILANPYQSAVGEVSTSLPCFVSGCFNSDALVWDASFTDDAQKLNAFFGAPSPTRITLKKRPSGAPLT